MFVSPAFAQVSEGAGGGFEAILPLVLIFVVFYFLLIRPQQKKMKQHKVTLASIRRGDKVVTGGGIIGVVTKVDDDDQVTIEIAKEVKVKVRRELINTVIAKSSGISNEGEEQGKNKGGVISNILKGDSSVKSSSSKRNPPDKKKIGRSFKKKNKESND